MIRREPADDIGSAPPTDLFLDLGPEQVLEAVDRGGLETRPVCYPLNSFENRVYEVELADRSRVVAKFYRPGRWSREQILEEHGWLAELAAEEIPICEVRPFPDGSTVQEIDGIFYSLWDRKGGRAPDELGADAVERLGMFVGRMHAVGARADFGHRPRLDADRYVRRQLEFLERQRTIPRPFEARYLRTAEAIAGIADRQLPRFDVQRIHGDLHLGNILFRDGLLRVLDFDDSCTGPAVQDLWLALPGRDAETERRRWAFLEGYERFRLFDPDSLVLVEILRGLRLVRYCGWLARRWHDPAFRQGWPHFGTEEYWQEETRDLELQLAEIRRRSEGDERGSRSIGAGSRDWGSDRPMGAAGAGDDGPELTNKDFFWDWEGD
jgi:Ser/Thr protein kinase RdoA (MazF antagonist)